jgi:hypothetical protein
MMSHKLHSLPGRNFPVLLTVAPWVREVQHRHGRMSWAPTVAEELRNDVRFALGWKIGKKLSPLTDIERDIVAAAIVDHIRLCNWNVERVPPWGGFAELGRSSEGTCAGSACVLTQRPVRDGSTSRNVPL